MKIHRSRLYSSVDGEAVMEKMAREARRGSAESAASRAYPDYRGATDCPAGTASAAHRDHEESKANVDREDHAGQKANPERTGVMAATASMHALSRTLKSSTATCGCSGRMVSRRILVG